MLSLSKVCKSFPECVSPVLKEIDFSVEEGEFCIIIGSNGSGKSTLLKTISGVHSCDSGTIILDGEDITNKSLYQRSHLVSTVTQDISLAALTDMNVLENMTLSLLRGQKTRLKFYERHAYSIEKNLKELGLGYEKYLHLPLGSLSGGQRQVIACRMALSSNPKILLLDEHTSALDSKTERLVMEHMAQTIEKQKITTLMVTHNLQEALRYGTRLLIMNQGEFVYDIKGNDKKKLTLKKLENLFYQAETAYLENKEPKKL
ncbi:MAG: ATP-binding cassette domain-containing protein [Proteobacteria bacterium]|nr:ATP-binding cassette domain-containing protein [Pseudomonadota bacterium]